MNEPELKKLVALYTDGEFLINKIKHCQEDATSIMEKIADLMEEGVGTVIPKLGNTYRCIGPDFAGEEYVLTCFGDALVLMCLQSGRQHGDSVTAKDVNNITEEEWKELTFNPKDFEFIRGCDWGI